MKVEQAKLLLVEDEEALGYLLSEYLGMKGFTVHWCKNGQEALDYLSHKTADLVILDVMMPVMDGFTLATKIKEKYANLPFLFLTSKAMKIDVLKGFSLGAIDYLKKPIDEEELLVRIRSIFSRIYTNDFLGNTEEIITVGDFKLDYRNQKLTNDTIKSEVNLTKRENELLKILVSNKNNLCTHRDILIKLWGENSYFNKKSLNVFITRLRSYLKSDANISIENVHGQGFILKVQ
ncbi:response regulator transcription factor [Croceivirga radicis]|uniref:response regulator transcription factor n=1 Tax=Croceivirga radicis TaxID=1929488 RepID=UPI000255AF1C|nr:response regulator transcription factor [Croceivirga radicis]